MTRSYHSPLRAEQTEQTRERIVAKVVEVLADPTIRELTIPEVAKRAGISVRTAYRHFPTKDALYDAVNQWWSGSRSESLPKSPDDYPRYVNELYQWFGETEAMVRARRHSKPLQEARTRRKQQQRRVMEGAFAPLTKDLDPQEAKLVVAAIHAIGGSDTYLSLRDDFDLTPPEAAAAMKWTMEALLDHLRRRAKAHKPTTK